MSFIPSKESPTRKWSLRKNAAHWLSSSSPFVWIELYTCTRFHVEPPLQLHRLAEKIQPRQGGLAPLKGNGAAVAGGSQGLFQHRSQGVLCHQAVRGLLPLLHNVMVKAVAAVQVAQPRGRLDKQVYVSHGSLFSATAKAPLPRDFLPNVWLWFRHSCAVSGISCKPITRFKTSGCSSNRMSDKCITVCLPPPSDSQ